MYHAMICPMVSTIPAANISCNKIRKKQLSDAAVSTCEEPIYISFATPSDVALKLIKHCYAQP